MSKKRIITYSLDPNNPPPLTEQQQRQLQTLQNLPDADIDLSDIPEMTDVHRPEKKQATIRLDADVLEWLRSYGKGYQTRINNILRREMLSHKTK